VVARNRPCAQAWARAKTCWWKALRFLESSKLDGLVEERGLVLSGVVFTSPLLSMTRGVCWSRYRVCVAPKRRHKLWIIPPLERRLGGRSWWAQRQPCPPPEVEDAGNGYLTLLLLLCWGGAHASCLAGVSLKSWKGESLKLGTWASGGCS